MTTYHVGGGLASPPRYLARERLQLLRLKRRVLLDQALAGLRAGSLVRHAQAWRLLQQLDAS